MPETADDRRGSIFPIALLIELSLAALAAAVALPLRINLPQQLVFDLRAILWGALAAIPGLAVMVAIARWPVGPLRSLMRVVDEVVLPLFRGFTMWQMAAVALAAGLGEEMLFRGVGQTALTAWLGLTAALVLTGLVFGLLHCLTPAYGVMAGLMSIYFGLLYWQCENLWAPVVAHAVYDFGALVYLTRVRQAPEVSDESSTERGDTAGQASSGTTEGDSR